MKNISIYLALLSFSGWSTLQAQPDNPRLINITHLEQLNAMRYDSDGDGTPIDDANTSSTDERELYRRVFGLSSGANHSCTDNAGNSATCQGYELMNDLDFEVVTSYASGVVDQGWSATENRSTAQKRGWEPIERINWSSTKETKSFSAIFHGNGHKISNLYVFIHSNEPQPHKNVGLFARTEPEAIIRNLGIEGGSVTMMYTDLAVFLRANAGTLVGLNQGAIIACYSTADLRITSLHPLITPRPRDRAFIQAGGLVGHHARGNLTCCYATGDLHVLTETSKVWAGGLVGHTSGTYDGANIITACYATGNVSERGAWGSAGGGLMGKNTLYTRLKNCYATGNVYGTVSPSTSRLVVGALVGDWSLGTITNTYFDNEKATLTANGIVSNPKLGIGSVIAGGDPGSDRLASYMASIALGQSTSQLQYPRSYTEANATSSGTAIYQDWLIDLDTGLEQGIDNGQNNGDATVDDVWDFGTRTQYPVLKIDFNGDGRATVDEFGTQPRAVPPSSTNAPPVFEQSTYNFTMTEHSSISARVSASDPDGHSLSYRITAVEPMNASGWFEISPQGVLGVLSGQTVDYDTLTGDPRQVILTVQADDGHGGTETTTVTITVLEDLGNSGETGLTITNISPNSGPVGAEVTLTGTGFSTIPAENTITFNGSEDTNTDDIQVVSISEASSTKLKCIVPTGAASGTMSLTTGGASTTSSDRFTVTPKEAVFSVEGMSHRGPFLYPNPSSGEFRVAHLSPTQGHTYSIYTLIGQRVLSDTVNKGELISLNSLAEGQYIFVLESKERHKLTHHRLLILK